jgi:hypothetical protein
VAANCIRNSIETKAENNRQKYPWIQRNLTENIIDSGARSKTCNLSITRYFFLLC